jgi:hypothetical protein
MPADDDKRTAQLAFLAAENVSAFYQQVLLKGYIETEKESLTQQIAHDIFPELEQLGIQREIGREPLPMTDAEIEAAAEHDVKLWQDARQERMKDIGFEPER